MIHESACDMMKYFTSRQIYFHKPAVRGVKIKPESEIPSHVTLMSVILVYSILDIFTDIACTRTGNSQCKVSCRSYPHPQVIF